MFKGFSGAVAAAALAASGSAFAQAAPTVVLPSPSQPVEAPYTERVDPAELAEARAIMEIMFPVEQRDASFQSMIQQMTAQFDQAVPTELAAAGDEGLAAILTRFRSGAVATVMPTVHAHLPRILDATAVAYTHEFSLAELKEIRDFAESPVGRHYLSRSSALLGDPAVAAANTAYFTDIAALAQQERQKLQAELTEYLTAHPELAERIANRSGND